MIGDYHLPGTIHFLPQKDAKHIVESYFSRQASSNGGSEYCCRVCEQCMTGYVKIYNHCLGKHLRIHCFRCGECNETFKMSSDLTKHMKQNHQIKSCSQDDETDFPDIVDISTLEMDKLAKKKINLQQEKMLRGKYVNFNLQLEQWECLLCTVKSTSKTTIQNHVYGVHYQVYIYKCTDCTQMFHHNNHLTLHRK